MTGPERCRLDDRSRGDHHQGAMSILSKRMLEGRSRTGSLRTPIFSTKILLCPRSSGGILRRAIDSRIKNGLHRHHFQRRSRLQHFHAHRWLALMLFEGDHHVHGQQAVAAPESKAAVVYYNEHAPFAVQWLRELCATGAVPAGWVDGRSIQDVEARDIAGHDIAHWFAGIGVWSYAVEQSGWPRSGLRTWSASLPCQPFSGAGQRRGFDDPRHLWPTFFRLVEQCEPDVVVGEQVSGPDGAAWLDVVLSDLEGAGYAVAALDTCSAGVGAPQRRQRLYWSAARVGNAAHIQRQLQLGGRRESTRWQEPPRDGGSSAAIGATAGYWNDAVIHECIDGYRRPLGPGLRTLAAGAPGAVDALRGIGNALNAEVAIGFLVALREALVGFDSD